MVTDIVIWTVVILFFGIAVGGIAGFVIGIAASHRNKKPLKEVKNIKFRL